MHGQPPHPNEHVQTQRKMREVAPQLTQENSLEMKNKDPVATDYDPHAVGTKLGNYVFGKNLGKGTFGKVKLATHTLTNELVSSFA